MASFELWINENDVDDNMSIDELGLNLEIPRFKQVYINLKETFDDPEKDGVAIRFDNYEVFKSFAEKINDYIKKRET
jgi:transcriptional regulator